MVRQWVMGRKAAPYPLPIAHELAAFQAKITPGAMETGFA